MFAQIGLVEALGRRFTPASKEAVQGLLQLAGEDAVWGWIVADMALNRVERGNKKAVPALEAGLKDANLKVRVQAARCLGRIDSSRVKDAVPVLREGLKLPDVEMRLLAADDLIQLDEAQTKHVIEALTPALGDKETKTSCRVAVFLLEADADLADKTLPVLREGLKSKVPSQVLDVLQTLGRSLRKKSERAKLVLPLFEKAFQSSEVSVRVEAIRQLANLGPVGLPSEKLLRDASKDKRVEVSAAAIEALFRIRPEKGSERLGQLIDLAEKRDRTARGIRDMLDLMEKLKQLNPPGKDDEWAASLADQISQRNKHESGIWHREELLRLHAIVELGEMGAKGKKGVPALITVLKDMGGSNEIVRGQAAVALGRMGKEAIEAIPALNRVAREEKEAPDVRRAARDALKLIGRDK